MDHTDHAWKSVGGLLRQADVESVAVRGRIGCVRWTSSHLAFLSRFLLLCLQDLYAKKAVAPGLPAISTCAI